MIHLCGMFWHLFCIESKHFQRTWLIRVFLLRCWSWTQNECSPSSLTRQHHNSTPTQMIAMFSSKNCTSSSLLRSQWTPFWIQQKHRVVSNSGTDIRPLLFRGRRSRSNEEGPGYVQKIKCNKKNPSSDEGSVKHESHITSASLIKILTCLQKSPEKSYPREKSSLCGRRNLGCPRQGSRPRQSLWMQGRGWVWRLGERIAWLMLEEIRYSCLEARKMIGWMSESQGREVRGRSWGGREGLI